MCDEYGTREYSNLLKDLVDRNAFFRFYFVCITLNLDSDLHVLASHYLNSVFAADNGLVRLMTRWQVARNLPRSHSPVLRWIRNPLSFGRGSSNLPLGALSFAKYDGLNYRVTDSASSL